MDLTDFADACRRLDPEPIADLALELMAIPSPPGDEGRMADRVATALHEIGADVRIDREYPASPSVIATIGTGDGPVLQWHGHLDAIDVPHPEPFRDGATIVGRGAADMKGPDAAMVAAARLLIEHELPRRGKVLLTLHGLHESGGNEPLHALIRRGIHGDAVITGELGGGVELPVAALGLTFWEITVDRGGMALHETVAPADAVDPVDVGHALHAALVDLRRRLAAAPGPSPKPSLFIGKFVAGDYYNRLAVRAELAGTRRHDETEDLASVGSELEALVDRVRGATGAPIDLRVIPIAESYRVDPGEPLIEAVQAAHRTLAGNELRLSRVNVASNAVHFVREAGIPAAAYGPDPATNHSDRESLPVAELARIGAGFALASALFLDGSTR